LKVGWLTLQILFDQVYDKFPFHGDVRVNFGFHQTLITRLPYVERQQTVKMPLSKVCPEPHIENADETIMLT
jgi:hypothetical protein